MKHLRSLPLFFALLLGASSASAQSVTLNERTSFEIIREEERSDDQLPNWLNRKDCNDASPTRFDPATNVELNTWVLIIPQIEGYRQTDRVEVWISQTANCADLNILNGNANSCSLVYAANAQKSPELYINPRDVIETDSSLRNWPGVPNDPAGQADTCEKQTDQSNTYYVLLRRGDDIIASASTTLSGVDTQAPSPPETVNAGPGDQTIFLDWEIDSANESDDTYGFAFFCVPTGTTSDLGLGGAGGAGGASGNSDCPQEILSANGLPNEETLQYLCGNVLGRTSRDGQTDKGKVQNGQNYAVAVAATDNLRNYGELSGVACSMPQEVTTFYEAYKEAGGKGGGGFCAFSGAPGGRHLAILFLSVFVLSLRRKRSRAS